MSPHICIGGREDAKDVVRLKELGVTHVLNCAKQLPSAHPKDFVHERLEILGEGKPSTPTNDDGGWAGGGGGRGGGRRVALAVAFPRRHTIVQVLELFRS